MIFNSLTPKAHTFLQCVATIYTQVVVFSGLKGQNIIAQGKVSGGTIRNAALGIGTTTKTVRAKMLNKANTFSRTELRDIMCREKETIHFVRNKKFSYLNLFTRTISTPVLQPRATPGFTGIALG